MKFMILVKSNPSLENLEAMSDSALKESMAKMNAFNEELKKAGVPFGAPHMNATQNSSFTKTMPPKEKTMTQTLTRLLLAAFALSFATPIFAAEQAPKQPQMTPKQQAEMDAYKKAGTPGAAHAALASQAGDYDIKMKSWHEAGAPPMEESGTATRKVALDGRVLIEDFKSTMMGQPFVGQGMTGYDNVSGKYWSTWNDSMSTGVMMSEGTCDANKSCKFTGSWNDAV